MAAHCAGEQNAYWAMNHQLFVNQRRLGLDVYLEIANSLALEGDVFSDCIRQTVLSNDVDSDRAYGQELGVNGTPTFFIGRVQDDQLRNARMISGRPTVFGVC